MREAGTPWVLGIAASHNGAMCLLQGDRIAVAVQEERLVRFKRSRVHGARDSLALRYCLECAGIGVDDLAHVVLCAQESNRSLHNAVALHAGLRLVERGIPCSTISHHMGHAIGAFATSGFSEAAVLVVDGLGSPAADCSAAEREAVVGGVTDGGETMSLYFASGTSMTPLEKHLVPGSAWLQGGFDGIHATPGMPGFGSLGGMYAAAGYQIFGDFLEGAGKVMGLAPFGRPAIPRSEFWELAGDAFVFPDCVPRRFRHDDKWPDRADEYRDLAASTQAALEEAVLYLARRLRRQTGCRHLCYAGGVALNSVANERILREAGFEHVFFMPAAEDSGTAIGAAYAGLWSLTGTNTRRPLGHDAVGREYSDPEIVLAIATTPSVEVAPAGDVTSAAVERLCAGQIVGWFQGRSELGPRALGQRSILCDPRVAGMKETLNRRVKHREGFRPFAPIVTLERAAEWFELDGVTPDSPHMLRVARFRPEKRALVPAVVHVDGTGRLQTLTRDANGLLYDLVRAFEARTGVPILLNTSFNVAGEPIVETPEDALWCLLYTGVDCCVLGDRFVVKKPAYRSVLDLYLRTEAEWVSFTEPVDDGKICLVPEEFVEPLPLPLETPFSTAWASIDIVETKARTLRRAYATFETRSRWGTVGHVTESNLLSIVRRFDGRFTGQEVLDALLARGANVEPVWFIRLIGRLRRAGIVSVHEQPVGDQVSLAYEGSNLIY